MDKIFVNVVAYRDPFLQYTIKDVLKKAKHPERIVFGVCWQYGEEEPKELPFDKDQVKVIKVPAKQSKGACWSRNLAYQLVTDEKYFWLIDSHMVVAQDWDEKLIKMYEQVGYGRSIFSCAVSEYTPPYSQAKWHNEDNKVANSAASQFFGNILLQMYHVKDCTAIPELNSFLTACNLFGPIQFIEEVPYDPDMFFLGEEISLALRGFTKGWNHYTTNENMAWHKHDRAYRVTYGDDHYDQSKLMDHSLIRLTSLCHRDGKIDLGMYDLGDVRSLEQYEAYAGINFKDKYISDRAKTGQVDTNYL